MRREDGFTLVELLIVMAIIAILVTLGLSMQLGARERSADATARSNIRSAIPAIEAYRDDTGEYTGMTVAALRSAYSAGIGNIIVEWATADEYCVSSELYGRRSWKQGPSGPISATAC